MADTESTEALYESDSTTPGDTSETPTSTLPLKDFCWQLMNEIDRLFFLKEDVNGLASITLSLDKAMRKHSGTKELFHVSRSLEHYCDILEDVITNLEVAEKALFEYSESGKPGIN